MDHARRARRLAGRARFSGNLREAPRTRSVFEIALDNAREGCVRETFGALLGWALAGRARDAKVRDFYSRIARDETRHASLSWRLHAWLRAGRDRRSCARLRRIGQGRREVCRVSLRCLRLRGSDLSCASLTALLLAGCADDRTEFAARFSHLDASTGADAAGTDAAGGKDGGVADAGGHRDAGGADTGGHRDVGGPDATGASDAPTCDDFLDGEHIASVPDVTTLTVAKITKVVATPAGVYFSGGASTCLSSQGCIDVAAIYFATEPVVRAATVVNARMDGFAIVGDHAYFFDETHTLVAVDLSTGTTASTGVAGSSWSGHSITAEGSALYWIVDAGDVHSLHRAVVASDGSVGTPELVRTSREYLGEPVASAGGLAWFEGRSALVLPTAAVDPETWFTNDAPELYWRQASNDTQVFVLSNDYGPSTDGGYIPGEGDSGGSQTLYPGPFLGAQITSRAFAGGPERVLRTSTIELNHVAATPGALLWVDTSEVPGDGGCSRLWRLPFAGGAPRLVASGWQAQVDGITTVGETVYWSSRYSVYRFVP